MIVDTPSAIFNKITRADYEQLVNVACKYGDFVSEELYAYYDSGERVLSELCDHWERSLNAGTPDFSVYSHPVYVYESFNCWKQYARRYLKLMAHFDAFQFDKYSVNSVIDLGCGCAYSTVALKSIFPEATIVGTNLKGSLQYSIDEDVLENIPDCYMVDESQTLALPKVDVVFASEFFEHLPEPVELLRGLVSTYSPKYFVFANTFTRMSIGHFQTYYDRGVPYTGINISRYFNHYLRNHGYVKIDTGFFNSRPQIFKFVGRSKRSALF